MRWILVFLFLYVIPLIVVFRNHKNFKRSCIYSSIYLVLATTIVISNIYISGLNKIEEALYYQHYANEDRYTQSKSVNEDNAKENEVKNDETVNNEGTNKEINNIEQKENDINTSEKDSTKETMVSKDDIDIIYGFKSDIYDIEKIALIPMRDCMPYTKNIAENIKKLGEIREDIVYARQKCQEAIDEYKNMEIPSLSKEEYTMVLDSARNDLVKTYELREKAMDSAIKLTDTKNPKYIGKITEYLKLSDNHIASFKDRVNDLKNDIKNN